MGVAVSSLDELKTNSTIRDMIKNAIQGTITQASDYQEEVKNVQVVNTQAHQIGMNYVYTKDNPLLAEPDHPITFTQSVKANSVVQTNYLFAYMRKNEDNVYTQTISYDLAGISVKDAADEELPNWYDPMYLIKLLGLTPVEAKFNFDKNGIEYKLTQGETPIEDYKKTVQQSFDDEASHRNVKRQWNEDHAEAYAYYSDKQKQLDDLNKQLTDLTKTDEMEQTDVKMADIQQQQSTVDYDIQFDLSKFRNLTIWQAYKKKYILSDADANDDYDVSLDSDTKRLFDDVINDSVYKATLPDMRQKYRNDVKDSMQKAGKWDNKKSDDENLKYISFITYFDLYSNSKYNDGLMEKYGDEYIDLKNKIKTFESAYSEFQINITYKAIADIKDTVDASKDDKKAKSKLLPDFSKNSGEWDETAELYDHLKDTMATRDDLKIEYREAMEKYMADHPKLKEQIDDITSKIDAIKAELSTQEASDAMTHYEYYETEPISDELIDKLNDDVFDATVKYNDLVKEDNEATQASKELFNAQCDMNTSKADIDYYKMIVSNSDLYKISAANISKDLPEDGNDDVKAALAKVTNDQKYIDSKKDLESKTKDYEQSFITKDAIVLNANDADLDIAYVNYLQIRQDWYDSVMGFEAVAEHEDNDTKKYRKKNEDECKQYDDNYGSYKTSRDHYNGVAKPRYDKLKKDYDAKYGTLFQDLSDALQNLEKFKGLYSTTQSTWRTYNEVCGDAYLFMSFDTYVEMLSSGYVQHIDKKISDITKIGENITENINESVYLYAMNIIHIEGRFTDNVKVVQSNDVLQEMKNGVAKVVKDVQDYKKLIPDDPGNGGSNIDHDDLMKRIRKIAKYLLIFLGVLSFILFSLWLVSYYKSSQRTNEKLKQHFVTAVLDVKNKSISKDERISNAYNR